MFVVYCSIQINTLFFMVQDSTARAIAASVAIASKYGISIDEPQILANAYSGFRAARMRKSGILLRRS
ncbi:MAG: hypothetical protein IGS23_15905 [Rivularia sp. T60_A2020_040]|nr:hypothetical protein [Rivularia sp. T60_A2020_040]